MTITLTTFVPGTKAKADEVNANFTELKNAVNEKAATNGDNTQTFSVADATLNSHAVNKGQLDDLSESLTNEINKSESKFCVKSGNTTNGEGDLFTYSGLEITLKIAGTYDDLVIADYEGTQTIISTTPSNLSLTGYSDGVYNIFITSNGTIYTLNNTIYIQTTRPTMTVNDVWLNTSCEPLNCIKYNGTSDIEFLDVLLGKVTVESNAITALETFAFNQNGYDVNVNTTNLLIPDYANGVTKSVNVTQTAEADGIYEYVNQFVYQNTSTVTITLNEATYVAFPSSASGSFASIELRVNKDDTYSVTSSHINVKSVFYPYLVK